MESTAAIGDHSPLNQPLVFSPSVSLVPAQRVEDYEAILHAIADDVFGIQRLNVTLHLLTAATLVFAPLMIFTTIIIRQFGKVAL